MSLEETREGEVAVAEKPKTTRKRAVKTEAAAPAVAEETPKPKVTRTRKVATKTEATPELPGLEAPAEPVADAPKKVTRRRTTKAAPEPEAAPQAEASAPVSTPAENAPVAASDSIAPQASPQNNESDFAPRENRASENNSSESNSSESNSGENNSGAGESGPATAENGAVAVPEIPAVPATFEGGNDYYNENGGYRSGRMSYRERRMMRREQRQGARYAEPEAPAGEGFPPAQTAPAAAPPQAQVPPIPGVPPVPGVPPQAQAQLGAAPPVNGGFAPANAPFPSPAPSGQGFSQPSGFPQGENRPYEPRENRFDGRRESRWERRERERRERMEARQNGEFGGERPFVPRRREYDFSTLSSFNREELSAAATEYGLDLEGAPEDDAAFVLAILEAQAAAQNATLKTGILEIINDSKAYLRCDGYLPGEADVYVSNTQIRRSNLKPGDLVMGPARAPKDNERYYGLLKVETVNGLPVEAMKLRKDFEKLTPIFPDERYTCETEQRNITARIIDLIAPIGKGQRGLIVAPPKAGKTTLIKNIANSIMQNYPEAKLFVLLIDERPEEVTDISRSVRGEVIASTFDETPDNHMRVAEIVMERAKRLAEMKQDVVILLDSITRLSRASNLVVSPSGRTLSGGLDPAAMYKPKRMFGAARNIEEGGSLTILATALVDTGSRMDEMIFEEFKGTGNMDLVLDRSLFDQRIFPAIDINRSGTRRDDLLMSGDELTATYHLRRTLAQLDNDKAVNLLIDRLKNTKSNGHFMEVVAKSARQQNNGS